MSESSQTLLRHILEAPYPNSSVNSYFSPMQLEHRSHHVDEKNFDKLKAAYDACLDEDAIKKAGVDPLTEILDQIMHLFPKQKSGNNDEEIANTVLYLASLGVSALVSPGTGADDRDPDTVVVSVSAPWRIGLPAKERYMDEDIVKRYEDTVAQVISALCPDEKYDSTTFHGVVEFEKKLASASPDAEDREDVTKYYNPMSLQDADTLTPQVHFSRLVDGLAPSNVKTTRLIVGAPQYMKDLAEILSNTPKDVLQVYFLWKAVQSFASAIEADAVKPYKRFSNGLQGKEPDSTPERWRTCVGHVDNGLGWILSRFFVERAFSAEAKEFGDQIVSDIKVEFIEKLKATEWMEEKVIKLAIDKVHNIVQKIGYPTKSPNIMDPSSLREYYQSVDITPSTFFNNTLSMSRFDTKLQWSALGKPVDRDAWSVHSHRVDEHTDDADTRFLREVLMLPNEDYNPPGNEIVFPAGIMQFPVFDVNVPKYVSYGAFGSVSGHELSHAFDSTGRHYDQNGNYTDWWTNKTVAGFSERADCFVSQYSNYTVEGADGKPLHVNGRLTLGENIADAGGLSASLLAWKKRAAEHPNQDLPGLEYFSQEQLFFVSYANWWCGKSRKETAINRIFTDPHAPKWARILGTMANSRDFRRSFHCPVKEPVCTLW
ncbi:hypothetical protein LTR16_000941 [Cryomyces antarcticus]|uniref:Zincin n=1 Tax=Cryomyces antarcticus TaxID=329879 RepID=A0ABR0LZW1_9PEZI|nr:hypothetical protein LTR39_000617 [Cryomyces antarcticus]KAK5020430.1 hypothetical protein LTR60_000522 [Cryomyces antarcticus]KAK5257342.1 hypothetical protein LTR16_000941 [Cryomyces antarcticus]